MDPISADYPNLAPYQFASNSPVANVDLDGGEARYFNVELSKVYSGEGKLIFESRRNTEDRAKAAGWFLHGGMWPYHQPAGPRGNGTLITFTQSTTHLRKDRTQEIIIEDLGELYIPEDGRGGFYFVSGGGGGYHSSGNLSRSDATPINIDLLVSAAGFPSDGGEIDNAKKVVDILSKGGKDLEKLLDGSVEIVKGIKGSFEAGDKAGEAIDKISEEKETKPEPFKVYVNGANPSNSLDLPQAIKSSADPRKPDTNYYTQPRYKTKKK
jgi:hypothetical protein